MNDTIQKAFSGWRIVLALVLGLSVSGWMFYQSISKVTFVESPTGNYSWVDANQNGKVDFNSPEEFQLNSNGEYSKKDFSTTLKEINWTTQTFLWLGVALLFMVGRDFFYMLRIRILTKNKLTWKASFFVIMLWEFASALSPGIVGGSAVAMFILNRETIPFGKATAIVVVTAFMDNLFYVVMIPIVFFLLGGKELFPESHLSLMTSFWIGFALIFSVCALLYLTIFWYPKLATRFLRLIFSLPFIKRWKFIAEEWGKDIELASKEFKQEPKIYWWKVFGATAGSWISRYLVINAIFQAFISLNLFDHLMIFGKQLVMWLFMLLPTTPGGSGVAEYLFGELLTGFGASTLLLAGMAILWRLISYFPYLFIGSIILPRWLKRVER